MSRTAKDAGGFYRDNPEGKGKGSRSPFERFMGSKQDPATVRERYAKALTMLRPETTGTFTAAKGYDLRRLSEWEPAQKRQIRRAFNQLWEYQNFGARVKTTKIKGGSLADDKTRKRAQKLSQMDTSGKFKYLYPLGSPQEKPVIAVDKKTGKVRQEASTHLYKTAVYFNRKKLFATDEKHIEELERVFAKGIYDADGNRAVFISFRTGQNETMRGRGAASRNFLGQLLPLDDESAFDAFVATVEEFQTDYDSKEHNAEKWLDGVNFYYRMPEAQHMGYMPSASISSSRLNARFERKSTRDKILRASPEFMETEKRRRKKTDNAKVYVGKLLTRREQLNELFETGELTEEAYAKSVTEVSRKIKKIQSTTLASKKPKR